MTEQDKMTLDAPCFSRETLEQHLRARAWKDNAFRQEFLTNPKTVLERDYAQYFPEGRIPSELSIRVIEEEEQAICFILPPKYSGDQHPETIDDQELLSLSGGAQAHITDGCNTSQTCYVTCRSTCGRNCSGRSSLLRVKMRL
jgi:hypothetical protein